MLSQLYLLDQTSHFMMCNILYAYHNIIGLHGFYTVTKYMEHYARLAGISRSTERDTNIANIIDALGLTEQKNTIVGDIVSFCCKDVCAFMDAYILLCVTYTHIGHFYTAFVQKNIVSSWVIWWPKAPFEYWTWSSLQSQGELGNFHSKPRDKCITMCWIVRVSYTFLSISVESFSRWAHQRARLRECSCSIEIPQELRKLWTTCDLDYPPAFKFHVEADWPRGIVEQRTFGLSRWENILSSIYLPSVIPQEADMI